MDKELLHAKVRGARRIVTLILLVLIGVTGISIGCAYMQRYNDAAELASITPIREMIINGVKGTKADAPVDPKTGDIYFPPAKVYLPYTSSYLQLSYAYDKDTSELSVANKAALNQGIAHLYSARNFQEVFKGVPYLQACQRGVTLVYDTLKDEGDRELQQTVKLSNGKTLYLYVEKACPELDETADILKNLKSY